MVEGDRLVPCVQDQHLPKSLFVNNLAHNMILLQQAALRSGMADQEAFAIAKQQALTGGLSFVRELIDTGKLDERNFLHQLADDMKWPWLEAVTPDPTASAELKGIIPARFAVKHQVLPVKFEQEGEADGKNGKFTFLK